MWIYKKVICASSRFPRRDGHLETLSFCTCVFKVLDQSLKLLQEEADSAMAALENSTTLQVKHRSHGQEASRNELKWTSGQEAGPQIMLGKAHEFFQICDIEDKGFITRRDMQRLHGELPLSLDELENVFDTLDSDGNGYLTLEEFTTGFSHFLHGEETQMKDMSHEELVAQLEFENMYQTKWEESTRDVQEEDVNTQFYNLIDSVGANRFLEDENKIKRLWMDLRRDEPHLLPSFEEFLTRVFSQLQEANEEKNEMECALKKKIATYDNEIQNLYEEMEHQIKTEKEQFLLQDTERFQTRSQMLEEKLQNKEQELEHLVHKQKRLESQCTELNNDKYETKAENEKLKSTNKEMRREVERTTQELITAQRQLKILQEEASQLHEEREMEVYRVTESLQRERSALLKQLDLLREMNKHLRDERDSYVQKSKVNHSKSMKNQRSGSIVGKYFEKKPTLKSQSSEDDDVFPPKRNSVGLNGTTETDSHLENKQSKGHHLRRIISIEEDHLPQYLDNQQERPLNDWQEVDEKEEKFTHTKEEIQNKEEIPHEDLPSSPRGQPVGKETLPNEEHIYWPPDRLFKIIMVGNSSVGKTSFLRRFCEDNFYPGTSATVGIDYSVKTVTVDNCQVALQLWDTAGQERYRSITKQFFRKADGVIVMYDITSKDSFNAVRQWLTSVEEGAGENIPILMLGNKIDIEREREVPCGLGEHLAKNCRLLFYECSASSGHNVKESILHLAKILKEQEDKVREKTIHLLDSPKKKNCCSRQ
ncbi:EF-hand calcium-binding domain-containing protein 4B isoform X2 [Bufo bufo]|uniref:EF-hand calcium-binding domain-containing protein 4B isoform X2 n=1 Tax=Bufo bufo TaxID=8384 RepID=UPI001ABDC974|nr:EF-hand calcium-binding domain-containing protein 4B isoform X2 [Bufo bufo]